jgi:DEAD/DEAH box helicase domain-containing protein
MAYRNLVLDLETQHSFEDIGDFNPSRLRVSCVGVYDYHTDCYKTYLEEELEDLENELAQCSLLIGFNHVRFDLPVLEPYLRFLKIKNIPCLDILDTIRRVAGHRVKLDSVAKATLNAKKSGHGLQAIKDWNDFRGEMAKNCPDFCHAREDYWSKFWGEWEKLQEKSKTSGNGPSQFPTWKEYCKDSSDLMEFSKLKKFKTWKKLSDYCLQDVKITKEIYDFGKVQNEIFFTAKDPKYKSRVPVDWNSLGKAETKQLGLF